MPFTALHPELGRLDSTVRGLGHGLEWERACDALAAFDAEHPQIIAALREQEADDVRRRLEFD